MESAVFRVAMAVGVTMAVGLAIAASAATPANRPKIVVVRAPSAVLIAAGAAAKARINVVIARGFHVQANPASETYLIPTRLELEAASGVKPGQPIYPRGRPYRLLGTTSDLCTYEGTFDIIVPLNAASTARPGDRILQGTLRYQACDARSCLIPTSVPVEVPITVLPAKTKTGRTLSIPRDIREQR